MRRRHLAPGLAALALGACAVGPGYERPPTPVPAAYRGDTLQIVRDTAAAIAPLVPPVASATDTIAPTWNQTLGDTVLLALMDTARAHNQDLIATIAVTREFQARYAVARSGFFPQVNVTGTGGTIDSRIPGVSGDLFTVSADAAWELDLWGRIRRTSEAGKATYFARTEELRGAELSLAAAVATGYFALLQYDRQLAVAERTLASRQETAALSRARFREGQVSRLDVLQFESQVQETQVQLASIARLRSEQENALSVLVGLPPRGLPRGLPLDNQVANFDVPEGLPSDLLARRPDVRAVEEDLRAANARIGIAWGDRLPQVVLTGEYGYVSDDLSTLFESQNNTNRLFLGVAIPIFTGGRLQGEVNVAQAQAEQARARYEQVVLRALQDVEDALVAIRTSREQVAAQSAQVETLSTSLSLVQHRYENGLSTYLEVLDAQRTLFNAELSLAQVQALQLASGVRLYKALGGPWSELGTARE
ncbi:MAG TPA: efflux transporter outer membrane subunit [Gemmatimonadales bacterium]|nr:efflux transporter outer membrane subunit [Gemmatimonadales bacterium]